jgi:hypothetical protein
MLVATGATGSTGGGTTVASFNFLDSVSLSTSDSSGAFKMAWIDIVSKLLRLLDVAFCCGDREPSVLCGETGAILLCSLFCLLDAPFNGVCMGSGVSFSGEVTSVSTTPLDDSLAVTDVPRDEESETIG